MIKSIYTRKIVRRRYTMKKHILFTLICFVLLTILLVLPASAETIEGTSITWDFNAETGALTVSGTGVIPSYASGADSPWGSHQKEIKSITIENGITTIGDYAFSGTTAETIRMADSVTSIGKNSFSSSEQLTSLTLSKNWTSSGNNAFINCKKLETVVIPASLNTEATAIFQNCISLKSVVFEDGVKKVGNDFFRGCKILEEVVIPASMEKLGRTRTIFMGCAALKKVTFLSATTEIPGTDPQYFPTTAEIHGYLGSTAEAFATQNGNTFVNLPEPDKYTGTCGDNLSWSLLIEDGLLTIKGTGDMTDYTKEKDVDEIRNAPWYEHRASIVKVVIEDGVTSIGQYAFNGCSEIKSATMTDSVTKISAYAFRGCQKMTSVYISKNVTSLGGFAFVNNKLLDNVVIPGKVTSVGTGSFQNCYALKNLTIENGVTQLGNDFFLNCTSLEEVKLPASLTKLGSDRGVFEGCAALKKVSFLSATTVIYGGAEAIPDGVEVHGYAGSTAEAYARNEAHKRTFVELPEPLLDSGTCGADLKWELTMGGLLTISGTGEMDDYTKTDADVVILPPWNEYKSQIKEIVIEDGVTRIGNRAFSSTSVTTVTMADSVTKIGDSVFGSCAKLVSITFSQNLESVGQYAFNGCKALASLSIPDSVSSFGSHAFNGCSGLLELDLGSGLTSMYNGDFAGCSKLTCVVLPRTLIRVGKTKGSFQDCTNLEKLVFLSHLTLIPDNAEAIPENAVIYCYPGSTAAVYAEKYDRDVVLFTEFKNDGEMVYEFTAGAVIKPEEGYAPLVSLALMDVDGFPTADLLFVNSDGALFVKNTDGTYAAFRNGAGDAILLGEGTDIAIAYNDAKGTARYYVNGDIPTCGNALAISLPVVDKVFADASCKAVTVITAEGITNKGTHAVDTSNLNFAGFQIHMGDDSSIRILAGLDTLYYDSVGFELTLYVDNTPWKTVTEQTSVVFSSIKAGGESVTAAELGYRYLTAIIVNSIDRTQYPADANVSLSVKPFVTVGGNKQYGDERTITVTYNAETESHSYEQDAGKVDMNGKKILVIGNSAVYYGGAVFKKDAASVTAQAARSYDKGYLYQLFLENGYEVEITNWTHGGHKFSDMRENPCSIKTCEGRTHLDYLLDREFDYVILSAGSGPESEASFMDDVAFYVDFFRQYNPAVKFVYLGNLLAHGHSSNGHVQHEVIASYKTLEDMGFIVADWGSMVIDIMFNGVEVPGATYEYTINSFIVKDEYHPGPLSGYITSLFAYCAITGESPVYQPYEFCYDASIRPEYDMDAYKASYYSASWPSNFLEIFKSDADMAGIQQLVAKYLEEKPYREYEVPKEE